MSLKQASHVDKGPQKVKQPLESVLRETRKLLMSICILTCSLRTVASSTLKITECHWKKIIADSIIDETIITGYISVRQ